MQDRSHSIGFEKIGIDIDQVRGNATKCPKCSHTRKKPNVRCLSINLATGHYTCHHCDFRGRVNSNEWILKQDGKTSPEEQLQVTDFEKKAIQKRIENQCKPFTTSPLNDQGLNYLRSRGISEKTAQAAKIAQNGQRLVFNYYESGKIVNAKYRKIGTDKQMWQHRNAPKRILWGIDNLKGSDKVIICEGEMDALSFYEIGESCAVSVSQGAPNAGSSIGSKLRCLENCAEILKGKKQIIVAVDNDANGVYLEEILCNRFGKDRCKVVRYPEGCKDANDVLVKFGADRLRECLRGAEQVPIDGVTNLRSVRENMLRIKKNGVQKGLETGIKALSGHFSFYKGWWNLYTGIPNSGKSEYVLYLMLCMASRYGWKWAVFSPEHWPAEDFYIDVVEKFTGNKINFLEDKDFEVAMDFVQQHFFFVYYEADKDGEVQGAINSTKNVIQSIKDLVLAEGIDGFMIDPFNQLTKAADEPRNERTDQYLERVLGMIDRLCKTHNLCGNIVAHPRTIYKDNSELDYKCPTAYQIAGGAMWYNKAYTITAVHRPFNQSDKSDKSVTIDIQKIKSHKRAGVPAPVDMRFDFGWYIGDMESREDAALYGAFESFKGGSTNGTQAAIHYPQTEPLPFIDEDLPF